MKLKEVNSPINGKVEVHWEIGWGKTIKVGGLTQSGGILTQVWRQTLRQFSNSNFQFSNILILGLGGGSAAKLIHKNWPRAKITGVDIDPIMVDLGKRYLGISKIEMKIEIADASEFVKKEKSKFDLILVDLYCGDKFPEKFENEEFLKRIKKILKHRSPAGGAGGIVVFNRLYGAKNRPASMRFGSKLEKVFRKVEYFYPQANLNLICYN